MNYGFLLRVADRVRRKSKLKQRDFFKEPLLLRFVNIPTRIPTEPGLFRRRVCGCTYHTKYCRDRGID